MAKAKTKRICGLEWTNADGSIYWRDRNRRFLHFTGVWAVSERSIKTRSNVLGVSMRAVAKTPRAAVAKLLRLEERVLRELMKGRVE